MADWCLVWPTAVFVCNLVGVSGPPNFTDRAACNNKLGHFAKHTQAKHEHEQAKPHTNSKNNTHEIT